MEELSPDIWDETGRSVANVLKEILKNREMKSNAFVCCQKNAMDSALGMASVRTKWT